MITEQQHCTVPQWLDEIRKLGRGMAGELHVVQGLTEIHTAAITRTTKTAIFETNPFKSTTPTTARQGAERLQAAG